MSSKFQPFQIERPWGYFRQFCKNTPTTVKIIRIKPNESLSLQSHAKREEFWYFISGSGIVEIDNEKKDLKIGDELIIPLGVKHRLTANSLGLEIMEISYGDFDEEDIIRYEDKYGRI